MGSLPVTKLTSLSTAVSLYKSIEIIDGYLLTPAGLWYIAWKFRKLLNYIFQKIRHICIRRVGKEKIEVGRPLPNPCCCVR